MAANPIIPRLNAGHQALAAAIGGLSGLSTTLPFLIGSVDPVTPILTVAVSALGAGGGLLINRFADSTASSFFSTAKIGDDPKVAEQLQQMYDRNEFPVSAELLSTNEMLKRLAPHAITRYVLRSHKEGITAVEAIVTRRGIYVGEVTGDPSDFENRNVCWRVAPALPHSLASHFSFPHSRRPEKTRTEKTSTALDVFDAAGP